MPNGEATLAREPAKTIHLPGIEIQVPASIESRIPTVIDEIATTTEVAQKCGVPTSVIVKHATPMVQTLVQAAAEPGLTHPELTRKVGNAVALYKKAMHEACKAEKPAGTYMIVGGLGGIAVGAGIGVAVAKKKDRVVVAIASGLLGGVLGTVGGYATRELTREKTD